MEDEILRMTQNIDKLAGYIFELKSENESLKNENERLKEEIQMLLNEINK